MRLTRNLDFCFFSRIHLVFFLGCSEVSSIFLVIMNFGQFFPITPGSAYDTVRNICGPLFAITFGYYRVYAWWKMSYILWSDCLYALKSDVAQNYRPNKAYVVYIFLTIDILLGTLQLYWFTIILQKIREAVMG
jgi:hypothetical protein